MGSQQKVDFFAAHSFDPAGQRPEKVATTSGPAATAVLFTNVPSRRRGGRHQYHPVRPFEYAQIRPALRPQAALEFLQKLPAGQSVALFVLSDKLRMVQNFTGSSDRLLAAAQAINPTDLGMVRSKSEAQQDDDFIANFARASEAVQADSIQAARQTGLRLLRETRKPLSRTTADTSLSRPLRSWREPAAAIPAARICSGSLRIFPSQ